MVRVHELAKELNLSSKDTITLLSKVGIRASTHMSVIDEHRARIVRGVLVGDLAQTAKTHKPAVKKSVAGNGAAVEQARPQPSAPAPEVAAPEKARALPKVEAASPAAAAPEAAPAKPAASEAAHAPVPRLRTVATTAPKRTAAVRPAHHPKIIPAASADPTAPIPAAPKAPVSGPIQQRPGAGAVRVGAPGFQPRPGGPGMQGRPIPGRPLNGPGAQGRAKHCARS